MRILQAIILAVLCTALGSCSYAYEVLAVARDGQLVFIVDPDSDREPSCLREVEVIADGSERASPEAGDDLTRVGYGTFWAASVDYEDDCENTFPLAYGTAMKGERQLDRGFVSPKPLLREVVYSVSTTTGATGYGQGRFIVHANGRVENLAIGSNLAAQR